MTTDMFMVVREWAAIAVLVAAAGFFVVFCLVAAIDLAVGNLRGKK